MKHRRHANYCEVCDAPLTNRGSSKKPRKFMLCLNCLHNPPEKYRCTEIKANGEKCRLLGSFDGKCHYHKESQSTSS